MRIIMTAARLVLPFSPALVAADEEGEGEGQDHVLSGVIGLVGEFVPPARVMGFDLARVLA